MNSSKKMIRNLSIISLLIIFPLIFQFINLNYYLDNNKGVILRTSAEQAVEFYDREWMDNNYFTTASSWDLYEEGDISDVSGTISGGAGNLIVEGEKKTYSNISGTPQAGDWTPKNNSVIRLAPTNYMIDSEGCSVYHYWSDPNDPGQLVSIHWDRNVTLQENMSDYIITSVSLTTTVNASVLTDSGEGASYQGIEAYGDSPSQQATGDFVRFYVLISDIYKSEVHEIAYYQSTNLGSDTGPIPDLNDVNLTNIAYEAINYHLTSVLQADPSKTTFTISLGMQIVSEDNYGYDYDNWSSLRIKSCDFSFIYEKKINQLTTAAWKQVGDTISSVKHNVTNNITIENVNLRFKFKISELWPTSYSPNTELRIFINDNQYSETINLERAETGWNDAKAGGYDVKSMISVVTDDVNLSIQLYLADEFGLNRTITVSITEVFLHIWYKEIGEMPPPKPGFDWTPYIIALAIAIGAATGGLLAYVSYYKYPPLVRKIRSLRRKVKKGKNLSKPIPVKTREELLRSKFKGLSQVLKIDPVT